VSASSTNTPSCHRDSRPTARPLRVLYICYLSHEDPLVQTQVVAYLEGLAERGHAIHLLTFDGRLTTRRRRSIEADLRDRGLVWHSARYHNRPSLPATVFDTVWGAAVAARLVRSHSLDTIHARSHVPAAMALAARRLTRCRLIFDVRGLMAEESADAGRWKRDGLAYRLTKGTQRAALDRADGVVVLTEAARPYLLQSTRRIPDVAAVIPCCADLERFDGRAADREAARREIDAGSRPVMVYVGKFTGWYMEAEMVDFYAVARRSLPGLLFLIVSQADPAPMLRELDRQGIAADDYRVLQALPQDLGRYLAICEFGISFIRPSFSKVASSPTKMGEYLAAGLPVVSSCGIGDVDALLRDNRVGVLVDDFSRPGYEAALHTLRNLCDEGRVRDRCREVARRQLSLRGVGIPRYDELYRRVSLS
jgi:glycosyltransferase involved in cell wall biosynthesis